jgi:hypothetical protein
MAMESHANAPAAARHLGDRRARCFCGGEIAPILSRLGSPWCHECRDSGDRRRQTMERYRSLDEPRAAA